ncbi:NUDIX domain-containing protein [Ornithinibacillus salinisoli]|uniref:NUDIX domain-containing protein n=1 Tax=Ornithinibacillus salinisoli TaxID=1848459 RepID=A0ABW4VY84_9BACI
MIQNNHGLQFLDFINISEEDLEDYQPIAGSFAVIVCKGKYLLCYNKWRNQWELPAGRKELGETSKECAIRELFEETGQSVSDMEFKGLLKVKKLKDDMIKYNPVYYGQLNELQPFQKNDEISEIMLWDGRETLPENDLVDLQIINYVK